MSILEIINVFLTTSNECKLTRLSENCVGAACTSLVFVLIYCTYLYIYVEINNVDYASYIYIFSFYLFFNIRKIKVQLQLSVLQIRTTGKLVQLICLFLCFSRICTNNLDSSYVIIPKLNKSNVYLSFKSRQFKISQKKIICESSWSISAFSNFLNKIFVLLFLCL